MFGKSKKLLQEKELEIKGLQDENILLNKMLSNSNRKITSLIAEYDKRIEKYYSDFDAAVLKRIEQIQSGDLLISKRTIAKWNYVSGAVEVEFVSKISKQLIEWLNK